MSQHHCRDYTVEQFMLQPSFVAWSLQSDPESVAFWNDWLAEHPDCRSTLEQARLMTMGRTDAWAAGAGKEPYPTRPVDRDPE